MKKGDIVTIEDDSTERCGGSKRSVVSGKLVEEIFISNYPHLFRIVELGCVFPDTNNDSVIQAITLSRHHRVVFIEERFLRLFKKPIQENEIGPLLPSQERTISKNQNENQQK